MNELTQELFEAVGDQPMDEERRQRVFGWLFALMRMPYLDENERKNALVLLDYLEDLEGGEVLLPLYRRARAKLSFEAPPAWEMEWPDNYQVCMNGECLSPDDLRRRGIPYVDFRLTKPIRNSTEFAIIRRLHSDGTVKILPEYQVFSGTQTGERHMFHVYGEKAISRNFVANNL